MNIKFSYDKEFDDLIASLKEKYGDGLFELDGIGDVQLDIDSFSRKFYRRDAKARVVADVSVDPNANIDDRTIISYEVEAPKAMFRLNSYYIMWRKIKQINGIEAANSAVEANIIGAIYTHDLHFFSKSYCYAYAASDIMREGLPFIRKIKSVPARHYDTFNQHIIQAVVYYSNSIAGAVALPDLFACWDWFIRNDVFLGYLHNGKPGRSIKEKIEQQFQILVYTLNQPFRGGHQSSFTNLSIMDRPFLESLFEGFTYPDGTAPDFDSIDRLQRHFAEWFVREYKRNIFTFPVMTAAMAVDENNEVIDKDFLEWISEVNLTNGIFNIYTGEVGNLSSCCRLRNSIKNEYINSFGSGGVGVGSHRVVTLNLPHVALLSRGDKETFQKELDIHLDKIYNILYAHRKIIEGRIKQEVLPLYNLYFMNLKRQYSTVGLIGAYEMLEILGMSMSNDEGKKFVQDLLAHIANRNSEQAEKTGWMYNTEQVPAEGAAIKLAEKDKLVFGLKNHNWVLYSNQFFALTSDIPLVERIRAQGAFDKMMDGGAILHINVAEKLESKEQMKDLIEFAAKQGVVYFAINYQMNRCTNNHFTVGKTNICNCGAEIVQRFSRVVGFYTNVNNWGKIRRETEYPARKFYKSLAVED